MAANANKPKSLTLPAGVPPHTPRPKERRVTPGWMLKPGTRTAFTRGCRCSVLPALESEMRPPDGVGWIHDDKCPLRKRDTDA